MKIGKIFAGFFMMLAMLMVAMLGGEPINGGGDAVHVWIVLGLGSVLVLSLWIVVWLSPEKKFYARSEGK